MDECCNMLPINSVRPILSHLVMKIWIFFERDPAGPPGQHMHLFSNIVTHHFFTLKIRSYHLMLLLFCISFLILTFFSCVLLFWHPLLTVLFFILNWTYTKHFIIINKLINPPHISWKSNNLVHNRCMLNMPTCVTFMSIEMCFCTNLANHHPIILFVSLWASY